MTLKLSVLPLIAAALLATATTKNEQANTTPNPVVAAKKVPGTPTIVNLVINNNTVVGTATVVDDQDLGTLTVTMNLNPGYSFERAQVYAGTPSGFPVNDAGEPRPNKFPNKRTTFGCGANTSASFTIAMAGMPTDVITMLTHARVYDPCGVLKNVWGEGTEVVDGGSFAMRFDHVLEVR
ncbi:MAG: hypothetical protein JNM68_02705 [Dinghuibacter sp.]|nr:hypothetical protein [Dinghuibacter sp.]